MNAEVDAEIESLPLQRLEHEIGELAAHIAATTCRWLLLVGEFDRREGWLAWGAKSAADWLSWRCGVAPRAAREQVRVGQRLAELPLVRAAFGRGEISYSKARAISRVASTETEHDLLDLARHATAAQLERLVRAYRGVVSAQVEQANLAHTQRYLSWEWDDDGSLLVRGRLPAEDGALVIGALWAARDQLRESGPADGDRGDGWDCNGDRGGGEGGGGDRREGGERDAACERDGEDGTEDRGFAEPLGAPAEQFKRRSGHPNPSNADALTAMAETLLANGASQRGAGERYQVIVHTDATALADDAQDGCCRLDDGPALPPETTRRLACDASLVAITERDGRPLSVGRKTRAVPASMRRALRSRDHGCRFPGCSQRRFVDAHHIHHWARGGQTKLSNLLLLCGHHHRLVHEGGYSVEALSSGDTRFRRPDGQAIPAVPRNRAGGPDELPRRHRRDGPEPTLDACVAHSAGDHFDYGRAVEGLLQRDGLLEAPPPPARARIECTGGPAEPPAVLLE